MTLKRRTLSGTISAGFASFSFQHRFSLVKLLYPQFPISKKRFLTTIIGENTIVSGSGNTTISSGISNATQIFPAPIQAVGTTRTL